MHRVILPLLCLLSASCAPLAAGGGDGWRAIFDGRTLRGWTPKIVGRELGDDPLRTFFVKDGAIRVSYERYDRFGGRFGHLAYRTPFKAYRVQFEYRFSGRWLPDVEAWQQSNSGIMLHGQPPETMGLDQQFPVSIEVQLLGSEREEPAPTGNLCTPGTNVVINGRLETHHCINSSSPVVPNGRWVKAEVVVDRRGTVTHFIEGKEVLRYSMPQYDPADRDARPLIARAGGRLMLDGGYIYLQSEGHPVEFRRIKLKPLD